MNDEMTKRTEEFLEERKEEKAKKLEKKNAELEKENIDLKKELDEMKEKQKKYNLPEVNKIERFNSSEDETDSLLESKLKVLKSQFIDMKEKLENFENISDIEKLNNIQAKMISNKSINIDSNKTYCGCCEPNTYLSFNFRFIGILFVMLNLVGVFQLISILNSTKEEMIFGIKSFLFARNRTYYFPENIDYKEKYENYFFNNIPDFNLLFLSSIIGNFMLKGLGYRFSSIIYSVINSAFIFIIRTFDFPDNYTFYKMILIIIYYILLFLSIGSIALFSQQIYFDGLIKYYSKDKEKDNDENDYNQINKDFQDNSKPPLNANNNEKPTFFFYLCFTEIPAYFISFGINYFFKKNKYYNHIFDIFIIIIIIYGVTTILSILLYCLYLIVFVKKAHNEKEKKLIRVYRILGYIIYCEKKEQGLKENENQEKENEKQEKENENQEKENKNNFSQPLFLEDYIINNNEDEDKKKKEKNPEYLKNQKDISCYSCKLGAKKFLEKAQHSLFPIICCVDGFFCCCKCCFKCCCCYNEEEDLSELNQGDEQFCYCYKIQRKISWFCDLLFKEEVLDFIVLNIINDLLTIGFQKKMKKTLKDYEDRHNLIILFFIIYFFFLSSMNKIYQRFWCIDCLDDSEYEDENKKLNIVTDLENNKDIDKNQDNKEDMIIDIDLENNKDTDKNKKVDKNQDEKKEKEKTKETKIKEYSREKLGLGIVLLTVTNFIITTIFSGFSLFGSKGLQNFTTFYLIPFPLALTKFYTFLLMNCLINIMDNGNIDLLSNSTIISICLMIYNLTTSFFTDILDIEDKALIIFQFSLGFLLITIISIFILIEGIDPDRECLDSCCESLSSCCESMSLCCECFLSFYECLKNCYVNCCCTCCLCCCNDE